MAAMANREWPEFQGSRVIVRFWPGVGRVAELRDAIEAAIADAVANQHDEPDLIRRIVELGVHYEVTIWVGPRRTGLLEFVARPAA